MAFDWLKRMWKGPNAEQIEQLDDTANPGVVDIMTAAGTITDGDLLDAYLMMQLSRLPDRAGVLERLDAANKGNGFGGIILFRRPAADKAAEELAAMLQQHSGAMLTDDMLPANNEAILRTPVTELVSRERLARVAKNHGRALQSGGGLTLMDSLVLGGFIDESEQVTAQYLQGVSLMRATMLSSKLVDAMSAGDYDIQAIAELTSQPLRDELDWEIYSSGMENPYLDVYQLLAEFISMQQGDLSPDAGTYALTLAKTLHRDTYTKATQLGGEALRAVLDEYEPEGQTATGNISDALRAVEEAMLTQKAQSLMESSRGLAALHDIAGDMQGYLQAEGPDATYRQITNAIIQQSGASELYMLVGSLDRVNTRFGVALDAGELIHAHIADTIKEFAAKTPTLAALQEEAVQELIENQQRGQDIMQPNAGATTVPLGDGRDINIHIDNTDVNAISNHVDVDVEVEPEITVGAAALSGAGAEADAEIEEPAPSGGSVSSTQEPQLQILERENATAGAVVNAGVGAGNNAA